jgi:hypothetical protein
MISPSTGSGQVHLADIVALALFIWSTVLMWASWQIGRAIRQLARERRELRRWMRLKSVYDSQRSKWQ